MVATPGRRGSTPAVTRTVALWTHGITTAASLAGGAVYGIRGLRRSDASKYEGDCESGVPDACSGYESTEQKRRVESSSGAP